jgi:hypothetical protein
MEKIDIMFGFIHVYDNQNNKIKTLDVNDLNLDLSSISDVELYTINMNNPIKRALKFQSINVVENAYFEEFIYDEMGAGDKEFFDNIVNSVNSLL